MEKLPIVSNCFITLNDCEIREIIAEWVERTYGTSVPIQRVRFHDARGQETDDQKCDDIRVSFTMANIMENMEFDRVAGGSDE